jgi:hypothetical protein
MSEETSDEQGEGVVEDERGDNVLMHGRQESVTELTRARESMFEDEHKDTGEAFVHRQQREKIDRMVEDEQRVRQRVD